MSRVFITGHKGYLGSRLFSSLKKMGHEVSGVDLKEGDDGIDCLPKNATFDYVFHMAALPRVEYSVLNPSYTLKNNVFLTSRVLEWSKNIGVKRFIFSSSSAVYGDDGGPNSPYGLHKLMSEMECSLYSNLYNLDTVSLRYFNIYSEDQEYGGTYSTAISAWMEMLRIGSPLRMDGDGNQTRDFIHADDIISANIFCMNHKERFDGKYFDIGTGKSVSLNYIKSKIDSIYNPKWNYSPTRAGDVRNTLATISDIVDLGWSPKIGIDEGLSRCF
jgi:UDP-glucose 4-epimerase